MKTFSAVATFVLLLAMFLPVSPALQSVQADEITPVGTDYGPNQMVVVLNSRRPNRFHALPSQGGCSRSKHRDAFYVRRWWAESKGAKACGCATKSRRRR